MIRLLDKDYNTLKELDSASLIWHEVYYGYGQCQLTTTAALDSDAKMVYNTDKKQVGIIYKRDEAKDGYTYYGYLLKYLLKKYIIYGNHTYQDKTPEYIAKDLVSRYAPSITIQPMQGLGVATSTQIQGVDLLTATNNLLSAQQLACDLEFDYSTGEITFIVWEGADHTASKPPLSTDFETINNVRIIEDDSKYANIAYVGGEVVEGQERTVVKVDASGGEDPVETWVDASDISRTTKNEAGEEVTLTEAEYASLLTSAGVDALQELQKTVQIPFDSFSTYELGEKRKFKHNGWTATDRVTELITSYEGNSSQTVATFGSQYLLRKE